MCNSINSAFLLQSRRKEASIKTRRLAARSFSKAKPSVRHATFLRYSTEPGWNLHTPEEIGVDDFQANRAPDKRYRTTPLKGLWTHTKGGFYHDGRFATLNDVVQHYDNFFAGLSDARVRDLVEYLNSL